VLGLVPSLSRPGGNITGISAMNADLAAKRLGLMRTLLPTADRFFALINPKDPLTAPFIKDLQAGSAALGIHIDLLGADSEDEIDRVFAGLPRQPGRVLLVSTNIFFFNHRARIVALAAQYGVPAMYDDRGYTVSGGLISYGADFLDVMRQTGIYTGRVLKGERPADLPVIQESKFEMVINLKTARALGLDVPPPLLSVADDVIE
jgi:putative ABC transport system substrate-binding protein